MNKHILLVDDDALLRASLGFNLTQAGYRASTAGSAEEGLAVAQKDSPDLILLDAGLPGMDGFEAIKHFQERIPKPVIMLTARATEMDEAWGLRQGADDYVTKPFSFTVLLARINSVLRRASSERGSAQEGSVIEIGDLRIDTAAHRVELDNRLVELRPREFRLLLYLAEHAETVVTADKLLAEVWGVGFSGEPQALYIAISRLREKLEDDPDHPRRIISLRGIGYKLVPQD